MVEEFPKKKKHGRALSLLAAEAPVA